MNTACILKYLNESKYKYRTLSDFHFINESLDEQDETTKNLCALITTRKIKRRLTKVAGTVFYSIENEAYLRKTFKWMFEEGTK